MNSRLCYVYMSAKLLSRVSCKGLGVSCRQRRVPCKRLGWETFTHLSAKFRTIHALHIGEELMKVRDGFNALVIVLNIVFFVWRMQVVAVQPKAHKNDLDTQFSF